MKSFEDFINENVKDGDWNNMEEQVKDSLLTNNVLSYFKGWMHENGAELLAEFWNSRSDACPLECEEADDQILAFRAFVKEKF